jgi:hypothetical protein
VRTLLTAAVALTLTASAGATTTRGTLAGLAQISHGCPGPVAENGPTCNPWHAYAGAHIRVTRIGSSWTATAVSDAQGRFALRLAPGSYSVTGVPALRTKPTGSVTVQIQPALTTRVVVRFEGFPMME